jgi:opacity protein-like surface antigen
MKEMKLYPIIIAIVMALALAPSTKAEDWYVDFFAGTNDTDDTAFNVAEGGVIDTTFDSGLLYGIAVGYRMDSVRIEGELSLRDSDVDSHQLNGSGPLDGPTGEASATTLMANVLYDFNTEGRVSPYIGAGLGFAAVDFEGFGVEAIPDVLNDDDSVFVYQAILGMSAEINDEWDFRADLRYLGSGDPGFETSAATGAVSTDADYSTFNITVGFRYSF